MERSENDDVYFAQDFNIFVLRIYFGSSSGACLLRRIYHPWRKIDSLINLINSTHLESISLHGHEIIQAFLFRSKPAPQHDLDPRSLKNVRNILHFFGISFLFFLEPLTTVCCCRDYVSVETRWGAGFLSLVGPKEMSTTGDLLPNNKRWPKCEKVCRLHFEKLLITSIWDGTTG